MYKVIANYDDPSSTRIIPSHVDLFHPILTPTPDGITFQQFINSLKVLWSRENILAQPDRYFIIMNPEDPTGRYDSPEYLAFITKLIEPIPDDKLYLLHFFAFQQINSENKLGFTSHRFTDVYVNSRQRLIFYCNPTHRSTMQYSYRGTNYADEIVQKLTDYERDQVHFIASNYGDRKIDFESGLPCYVNSFLSLRYQQYLQGMPYCHSLEGMQLTAKQVRQLLESDPNAQLIETHPEDRTYAFTIRSVVSKQNKAPLYRCMNYTASPTTLLQWPLTAKGEHEPMLYGVELELATDYSVQQIVDATDEPFFICKQDSSVTGNKRYKYELATVPMSFKAHKKQWAFWFSNLDYDKFDTTKDTNNGMHVHIGKTSFSTPGHIKNFVWFVTQPAHLEFMTFFSQRDQRSLADYAVIPQPTQNRSRVQAFRRQEDRVKEYRGAVHFSPKGTIEIRLFRGIVSLAEIIKNLEFVDSIFRYTMQGQNFTKMSLKEYIKWLHAQPRNKYALLKKYLERTPKLQKLIDAAALLDLIFTEKEPNKILALIEKNKFQVNNSHVTILNQRWRKRIFVLKNGKLILNPDNMSSISTLDRLLEQRILGKAKRGQPTAAPPPPIPEEITATDVEDRWASIAADEITLRTPRPVRLSDPY